MGSEQLVLLLEEEGLITRESIARVIANGGDAKVREIRERASDATLGSRQQFSSFQPTIFNYFAGGSIRGDNGCMEADCRADRAIELARFSLLYAEKVVLPVDFRSSSASNLAGQLMVLSELRPLIDLGIVVPISSELHFCREHANEFQTLVNQTESITVPIADQLAKEVTVTFIGMVGELHPELLASLGAQNGDVGLLNIEWPAEFEAGSIYSLVANPETIGKLSQSTERGGKVPPNVVRELSLLSRQVSSPTWDYLSNGAAIENSAWTYLSNSPLEMRIIQSLSKSAMAEEARNKALSAMAHEIPLFAEVSMDTLLEVRRNEGDLFATYRSALNEAIAEVSESNKDEGRFRQIYQEILAPKVNSLELREKTLQARFRKNLALSYLPAAAGVAMGMFPNAASTGVTQIIGKLAEGLGLATLCTQLATFGTSADSIKTDPFYFLLKLKRTHQRECAS